MDQKRVHFQVGLEESDRIDKYLTIQLPDLSRSRIQTLIKNGAVLVDQTIVKKTGFIVEAGQEIEMEIPETVSSVLVPEKISLTIIFENEDLAIINKPAGMVVHPAAGHDSGTLVHAALAQFDDLQGIGGEFRPGIVHRLDKDTSGLIVIAKNEKAHHWLQEQFRSRLVEKTYLALVDGKPPTPSGRVEAAIARDPSHRKKMAVVSDGKGKPAVTEYKTLRSFPLHTLIEAHPFTGRTHQIRLHMAFLKCPITGDKVYGSAHPSVEVDRHFLHAAKLKITLPGQSSPSNFEAQLPEELERVLESIQV